MSTFTILSEDHPDEYGALLEQCGFDRLSATEIRTLQVNVGRMCNQVCRHCHIDAGPHQTEMMDRTTIDHVIRLSQHDSVKILDVTGGAPEMHPDFRYLVERVRPHCQTIIDRCNLTILLEPGYEDLAAFLAKNHIEIVASLPCYEEDNVDSQRGNGVFEKSIAALQKLNSLGYGEEGGDLVLNLIFNPVGASLAPPQEMLEGQYKSILHERYGIRFNSLFAMNNVPINRFETFLRQSGQLESYMHQLAAAYNLETIDSLMCRHQISIRWDGRLHDCDFNLIKGLPLADGCPQHVRDLDLDKINERRVSLGSHCLACTAGHGSSCTGALSGS
ncbi:MAG: arsenosugar biosynthesis radical SAM (seleno)protein ArsS [Phycisphaerae bacterium]